MNPIRILCLGDSLTFGSRDQYHRGYPVELMSMFRLSGHTVMAENHGVAGDTSSDLARRLPLVITHHYKLAIILIGTNDLQIPMPREMFTDNLLTIMSTLEDWMPALWCTLPPVGGYGLPMYSTEHWESYNDIIRSVGGDNLVDLSDMGEYLVDTVHFGNEGYKEMARRIFHKVGVVSWT